MTGWPPTKAELEELYLERKLSADDVAAHFGRTGKYPGAIVYHYLRKYGIPIRDRTAHQRHMSEEEIASCAVGYRSGKSLWDLADEYPYTAETIRKALISHGVETRDKVEAQIQKVTKHQKHPFSGDPHEKAYLYGLRQGDLWVTRHGRAIRVKTSTTHPAMEELVTSLFLPYGPVHLMPRRCEMTGHEWSLDCDLDQTFSFLEEEYSGVPDWVMSDTFEDYVAGFFDAEGSVMVLPTTGSMLTTCFTNTNLGLLKEIQTRLGGAVGDWRLGVSTRPGAGGRAIAKTTVWQLKCWRRGPCLDFLSGVPFRHPEKKAKARLILDYFRDGARVDIVQEYARIRDDIASGVTSEKDLASVLMGDSLGPGTKSV